jgi:hypothetical protein
MSTPAPIAQAVVGSADAAIYTNNAAIITTITAITLTQPAAGGAKTIAIGIGTTATAANVQYNVAFAAGVNAVTFYPGWVLTGTQTLNVADAVGAQANIKVSGLKDAA